jgi:hypothetical protein
MGVVQKTGEAWKSVATGVLSGALGIGVCLAAWMVGQRRDVFDPPGLIAMLIGSFVAGLGVGSWLRAMPCLHMKQAPVRLGVSGGCFYVAVLIYTVIGSQVPPCTACGDLIFLALFVLGTESLYQLWPGTRAPPAGPP